MYSALRIHCNVPLGSWFPKAFDHCLIHQHTLAGKAVNSCHDPWCSWFTQNDSSTALYFMSLITHIVTKWEHEHRQLSWHNVTDTKKIKKCFSIISLFLCRLSLYNYTNTRLHNFFDFCSLLQACLLWKHLEHHINPQNVLGKLL